VIASLNVMKELNDKGWEYYDHMGILLARISPSSRSLLMGRVVVLDFDSLNERLRESLRKLERLEVP
jgi:hypothetical protein